MSSFTKKIKDITSNKAFSAVQSIGLRFVEDVPKSLKSSRDLHVCLVFDDVNISNSLASLASSAKKLALCALADKVKTKFASLYHFTTFEDGEVKHFITLGGGSLKDCSNDLISQLGGIVTAFALSAKFNSMSVAIPHKLKDKSQEEMAAYIAYGSLLRSYRFDKYKKFPAKKSQQFNISVVTEKVKQASNVFQPLFAKAMGEFLARDLVAEPANILFPKSYAKRCSLLKEYGLKVKILGEKEMTTLSMGSLLGVGQGSRQESQLVVMEHLNGAKNSPLKALVGKGVCFDTGGISLKPAAGMDEMKADMGGSAAVVGAMLSLALSGAKKNTVGVIGVVENMPDGLAQRPGDVVTSMSGQTIEVLNTDAEGRLVLADALTYVQKTYKPSVVIDLATLTGAIIIALGYEFAGLFTNDDKLRQDLLTAGSQTNQPLWYMPCTKENDKALKSEIADMQNIGGGREAGSSTAAAFLQRFIEDGTAWAHLDIAGVAWEKKDKPTIPKGASGFGVKLLTNYVLSQK